MDGFVGEEIHLQGRLPGFGELGQTLSVGLGSLVPGPEQGLGDVEGVAVEGLASLDQPIPGGDATDLALGVRDPVVGGFGIRERSVLAEPLAELAFGLGLPAHEHRIQQAGHAAIAGLPGILEPEELVGRPTCILGTPGAP